MSLESFEKHFVDGRWADDDGNDVFPLLDGDPEKPETCQPTGEAFISLHIPGGFFNVVIPMPPMPPGTDLRSPCRLADTPIPPKSAELRPQGE